MKSKPDMGMKDWDAYYATEPDESARRLIYRKLVKFIDSEPGSILDIGCAMGDGLIEMHDYFPEADLYGVDYSAEGVAIAHRRLPLARFFEFDMIRSEIPYQADLVLCVQTLEHFRQDLLPWIISNLFVAAWEQVIVSVPYGHKIPDKDHKTVFFEESFGNVMKPDIVERQGHHLAFSWIRRQ